MKGWLRLGILFLIIISCIVVVDAAPTTKSSCGKTVQVGDTVDISKCVSSTDIIGMWPSQSNKNKSPPSQIIDLSGFDIQAFTVPSVSSGYWYVVGPNFTGTKKVFTIV
jgi:hypothetical protein